MFYQSDLDGMPFGRIRLVHLKQTYTIYLFIILQATCLVYTILMNVFIEDNELTFIEKSFSKSDRN